MNNTMLWVIVAVAAVLTLGATLYLMNNPGKGPAASNTKTENPSGQPKGNGEQPQTSGDLAGDRLPEKLDGFMEKFRSPHIDPVLEGENHSATVTFEPAAGSIYERVIESIGVTVVLFDDPAKISQGQAQLLTQGLKLEPTKVEDSEVQMGVNAETGDIGVTWTEGRLLFLIATTLSEEGKKDPKNLEILKRAAIMAATMVLKTKK
ncbi:hypothetical protein HY230_00955 [Candidatus Acetothermia bacterium]|nr:hypothetical protein [Candidatus Acetothermia bacterium]